MRLELPNRSDRCPQGIYKLCAVLPTPFDEGFSWAHEMRSGILLHWDFSPNTVDSRFDMGDGSSVGSEPYLVKSKNARCHHIGLTQTGACGLPFRYSHVPFVSLSPIVSSARTPSGLSPLIVFRYRNPGKCCTLLI